jgi:hypothetical protein
MDSEPPRSSSSRTAGADLGPWRHDRADAGQRHPQGPVMVSKDEGTPCRALPRPARLVPRELAGRGRPPGRRRPSGGGAGERPSPAPPRWREPCPGRGRERAGFTAGGRRARRPGTGPPRLGMQPGPPTPVTSPAYDAAAAPRPSRGGASAPRRREGRPPPSSGSWRNVGGELYSLVAAEMTALVTFSSGQGDPPPPRGEPGYVHSTHAEDSLGVPQGWNDKGEQVIQRRGRTGSGGLLSALFGTGAESGHRLRPADPSAPRACRGPPTTLGDLHRGAEGPAAAAVGTAGQRWALPRAGPGGYRRRAEAAPAGGGTCRR